VTATMKNKAPVLTGIQARKKYMKKRICLRTLRILLLLAPALSFGLLVYAADSNQDDALLRPQVTLCATGKKVPRILAFSTSWLLDTLREEDPERQIYVDLLALVCKKQKVSNPVSKEILQEYGLINEDGSACRNSSMQAIMEAYYDCAKQRVQPKLFDDCEG